MSFINPNHPFAKVIMEHQGTIMTLMVIKAGGHIVLASEDLTDPPTDSACAIYEDEEGLHFVIMDKDKALSLARHMGGMPQ